MKGKQYFNTAMSSFIRFKRWIHKYFKQCSNRVRTMVLGWAEFDTVKTSLTKLRTEVDYLENVISALNLQYRMIDKGVNVPRSIIKVSMRQVKNGEKRINRLIVRINQKLKTFRSGGKRIVKNMEWWISRAKIVIVGGLVVLAAFFAVTGKLA